ncbi:MAG TPA: flagellar assembly protein FliW [Dissulfurispiraceae bacterium]|nr:flagellar assembly protein FliW [Dissulfurispiraceae bacterium]
MLKIQTTRFGELEVEEERILSFPLGIPGFSSAKQFFLIEHAENIWWLQAADDADLAFIVTEPFSLFPEYAFRLSDDLEAVLQIVDPQSLVVFAIVSADAAGACVNLRAPIVINSVKLLGAQFLSDDENLSFRTPLPNPLK